MIASNKQGIMLINLPEEESNTVETRIKEPKS